MKHSRHDNLKTAPTAHAAAMVGLSMRGMGRGMEVSYPEAAPPR